MAATSVTGTGPGDSGGKQKPENHCGCCCGQSQETTTPTRRKRGCVVRHVAGRRTRHRAAGSGVGIRVC